MPKRGGHRRSLASHVNSMIREEADPDPPQSAPGKSTSRVPKDPLENLAARVAAKLEEGDFRGAIRLASSEDTMAEVNSSTLSALQEKHPLPHRDSALLPTSAGSNVSPIQVSAEEVAKAICSFPCGSSGGPDGLRPQHLKDMTGSSAAGGGQMLLQSLTSFINFILAGEVTHPVRHFFFGATLIALNKKDGGVRPIAVGCTLRRLAAKCAGNQVMKAMGTLLAPHQLGYGVPLGSEAAVHAARIFLHNLQPGQLIMKLDFRNAFNSLRRDKMVAVVEELVPELLPLVLSAYGSPSSLFFGEDVIQSSEGVQQGDPLGPLLFCLTIHNMVQLMRSDLNLFYLDDGTLGGNLDEVLLDFRTVEQSAAELGLQLNLGKTEIICTEASTRDAMLQHVPGLCTVQREHASLLGSPIGTLEGIQDTIRAKKKNLEVLGVRLRCLHAHDALCLLRHAFAIPKLLYVIRTSPCFLSPELQEFDSLVRSLLSAILNICLNDSAWTQASLPIRCGGLGVRSATQLAPSAYLASAAGSADLVRQIVPPRLQNAPCPDMSTALIYWRQGHTELPPVAPTSCQQKAWDSPRVTATAVALLEAAPDQTTRARLLATRRRESGAWLQAPPMSALGLRMDDDVVRVAVGLRLGVSLCQPHHCHQCGTEVDHLGLHGLSCRKSQGRHSRHAAINELIRRALASARVPSHLEPSGTSRVDGKRPDGATVMPWKCGRALAWDATCPDTYAPSHLALAAREAGAVANQAEQQKTEKYAHLSASHHFVPFAVETSGVFGPEALSLLEDIGRRIRAETGEPRSFQFLLQGVSVAIQRGNAASVLGTAHVIDNVFF